MRGGFYDEAMAWRNWLLRATAGDPSQLQIMYGAAGERRLDEWEIDWLPGYEDSAPVRIGNAAAGQFQLDVYGEVMSALYESAQRVETGDEPAWEFQMALMDFLETGWREPDDGIWEVRGPRRHFTHSKVMAWVAIDRAVKSIEDFDLEGPSTAGRQIRQEIHDQVCDEGFNTAKGSFTQYYGSDNLDASLLMIPLVGFLPAHDPRVRGTIEAIERELMEGGFVLRYQTDDTGQVDGLVGREGAFLACSFWLTDCLSLLGRDHDARQLLDRLLGLRNDLGLLSEEYDPVAGRLVGNFPQAFSHVSLVNSASKIGGEEKPPSDHVMVGLASSPSPQAGRGGCSARTARPAPCSPAGRAPRTGRRTTTCPGLQRAAAVPAVVADAGPRAKRRVRDRRQDAGVQLGHQARRASGAKAAAGKKAATAAKKARATSSATASGEAKKPARPTKRSARRDQEGHGEEARHQATAAAGRPPQGQAGAPQPVAEAGEMTTGAVATIGGAVPWCRPSAPGRGTDRGSRHGRRRRRGRRRPRDRHAARGLGAGDGRLPDRR